MKLPIYAADFETVVDPNKTRVWLWGMMSLSSDDFKYGTDITSFMEDVSKTNRIVYFHNLKFDGTFILYWLFHNGYKFVSSREGDAGQFTTLISDMGLFYNIVVFFRNGKRVEFRDSLKKIPMAIKDMPKAFGLPLEKLDLDYEEIRDMDHIPTRDEIMYVEHDVKILAMALKHMEDNGMKKVTVASNALSDYRKRIGSKDYSRIFPQLDVACDKDCRKSYKGGWTYVNPGYQGIDIGKGQVYDVNSMYPWAMKYGRLPYGIPVYYNGKYENDDDFPLYIQNLSCKFKLKKGKYPSIQLKGSIRFNSVEYLSSTNDEEVILTLTSVDLDLLFENYDVYDITWNCGYKFRASNDLFSDYIDYWYEKKTIAKKEGNKPIAQISKLMLNSLYGKFGSNPVKQSKYPWLDPEKDIIRYSLMKEEIGNGGYVPVASFITSYCRDKIIRAANACGDRFIYADTDSLHILGDGPIDIDIDEYRLGAFKCESHFTRAKYLRAKCYIEEIDGELDKKCAGLPVAAREYFDFDTMETGHSFDGKLRPVNVPGGQVLIDTKFTIK